MLDGVQLENSIDTVAWSAQHVYLLQVIGYTPHVVPMQRPALLPSPTVYLAGANPCLNPSSVAAMCHKRGLHRHCKGSGTSWVVFI